jgi:hypothetical protein
MSRRSRQRPRARTPARARRFACALLLGAAALDPLQSAARGESGSDEELERADAGGFAVAQDPSGGDVAGDEPWGDGLAGDPGNDFASNDFAGDDLAGDEPSSREPAESAAIVAYQRQDGVIVLSNRPATDDEAEPDERATAEPRLPPPPELSRADPALPPGASAGPGTRTSNRPSTPLDERQAPDRVGPIGVLLGLAALAIAVLVVARWRRWRAEPTAPSTSDELRFAEAEGRASSLPPHRPSSRPPPARRRWASQPAAAQPAGEAEESGVGVREGAVSPPPLPPQFWRSR